MSEPLPPVPPCDEDEEVCTPPGLIYKGTELMVIAPGGCARRLGGKEGGSLPLAMDGEVENRDGSKTQPITLEKLMKLGGSFPYVLISNGAGSLAKIEAPDKCTPHAIIAKDGSFQVVPLEQNSCWEQICENNEPQQIAAWVSTKDCDEKEKWCLVRMDIDALGINPDKTLARIVSTQCIQVTGTGTQADPYKLSVKISNDEGNCLECREDGLFAPCGSTYGGSDPLDEL